MPATFIHCVKHAVAVLAGGDGRRQIASRIRRTRSW